MVGRKIRDLGMVVDLIFLNTEVSLTQALEDVGRARTPFAIIITQQHQVHRSCTVNILFGTPQGNTGQQHAPVGWCGSSLVKMNEDFRGVNICHYLPQSIETCQCRMP